MAGEPRPLPSLWLRSACYARPLPRMRRYENASSLTILAVKSNRLLPAMGRTVGGIHVQRDRHAPNHRSAVEVSTERDPERPDPFRCGRIDLRSPARMSARHSTAHAGSATLGTTHSATGAGHRPITFPIRTTFNTSKSWRCPSGVTTRALEGWRYTRPNQP